MTALVLGTDQAALAHIGDSRAHLVREGHPTRPGDRFVLTTDGVHAVLPAGELAPILVGSRDPQEAVDRVEAAVLVAGSPDNYAVVVAEVLALA